MTSIVHIRLLVGTFYNMPNRPKRLLLLCANNIWRNSMSTVLSRYQVNCLSQNAMVDLTDLAERLPPIDHIIWVSEQIESHLNTPLNGFLDLWPNADRTLVMCQSDSLNVRVECKHTLMANVAHCYIRHNQDIPNIMEQVLDEFLPNLPLKPLNLSNSQTPNAIAISPNQQQTQKMHQLSVVASSTGGVQALSDLLTHWPAELTIPTVIAHHLPARFQSSLSEILGRMSNRPVHLVKEPTRLENAVYISPFDYHLRIEETAGQLWAYPHQGPKEHFLRPAADPLFRSAGALQETFVMGVVLTGMGHDGAEGSQAIHANGGRIICQDEASSVVWGMPKRVFDLGITEAVLSPNQIGRKLMQILAQA